MQNGTVRNTLVDSESEMVNERRGLSSGLISFLIPHISSAIDIRLESRGALIHGWGPRRNISVDKGCHSESENDDVDRATFAGPL